MFEFALVLANPLFQKKEDIRKIIKSGKTLSQHVTFPLRDKRKRTRDSAEGMGVYARKIFSN